MNRYLGPTEKTRVGSQEFLKHYRLNKHKILHMIIIFKYIMLIIHKLLNEITNNLKKE